mmetsp:Transcript_65195/g.153509  ORF Transcript_65195/g.153509 Transcript_65195/m.153509 type:complete len:244 (+) Transcript_65195:183-914(+)
MAGQGRHLRATCHKHHRSHMGLEIAPRWLAGDHLDQHAPEAPNVSCLAIGLLVDDFWSHPLNRAAESVHGNSGHLLGAAEVCKLHDAILGSQEDIGGLEIPMKYRRFARVQIVESFQHLARIAGNERLLKWPVLRNQTVQGAPGHVLKEDVQGVAQALRAEKRHDVRMLDLPVSCDFPLCTKRHSRSPLFHSLKTHLLHGHGLSSASAPGLPDRPKRSTPQQLASSPFKVAPLDQRAFACGVV